LNAISHIQKAAKAWKNACPDWILVLAEKCEASSQNKVAKEIGYSAAVVSTVLSATYKGDLITVEKAVRGAFMAETVYCPVLGEMASNACLEHQNRPFASSNSLRVRLYKACRSGCTYSRIGG
jgi:hypothetical protein